MNVDLVGGCDNCGRFNFVEDFGRGDILCGDCGLVADRIFCFAPSYSSTHDAHGNRTAALAPAGKRPRAYHGVFKGPTSTPYKRGTYFNEKLAQYRQLEPEIPEKDADKIYKRYRELNESTFKLERWYGEPNKEHIRQVLGSIDADRKANGKKPRFVRVYLERWRTLRCDLCGVKSDGCYVSETNVRHMRRMFQQVEWAFKQICDEQGHGRISFINYDFVMRRLLELFGIGWAAGDLHPLKTRNKQARLVRWWAHICRHLKIPYINRDAERFPDVDFYELQPEDLVNPPQ